MATVKLSDISSAAVNATVLDDSVIGKTPSTEFHFLRSDVIGALSQTLDQVQINCVSMGFDCEPSFPLAGGTAKFTAGGGPTGELDLYKPAAGGASCPLLKTDQFGTKIEMGSNYYLALSFQLGVKAGVNAKDGAYTFTPSSSATGSAKLYLPFGPGVNGAYPTLQSALETLFGAFALPSSKEELRNNDKFPVGSVFAYDAQGTVGFKTKINFLTAINPTATPGVSTSFGPISVTAGPSVTVGGGFTLSGEIETRIWKKSASVVQVGYYKKQGSSFNVSLDIGAAADATVGGFDVIAQIYGLLGDAGKLDPAWLKAHVPASVATDVQNAYKAAVETKLSIAIDEECDTAVTDQAAFSWNFDLSVLDVAGQSALSDLLNGDLTALLSGANLPAGITKAGSILDRTTDVKHTFSFNFLGLFDHASVNDATLDMSAKVSEDGQLIITDTAHLKRLAATATPLDKVKADQLRKVYVEDCVATIGYSASFGSFVPTLKVGYNYFSYKRNAHQADLQLFVDTAKQIGEANAAGDWAVTLQSNSVSQAASLYASLGYDGVSGRNLFLDAAQNPRSIADYQQVGRNALLNTPGLGLSPQFVAGMNNPTVWPQLLDAGSSQHFYQILEVDLANPPQWAVVSFTWTLHVVFWASAMHSTAMALQSVLQYLAKNPGIYPLHDAGFLSKRKTFASQLQSAIQKAPLFDDALGLMTIFGAATPLSKSVTITYASVTKTYA
jgi:hypothetical protein